MTSIIARQLIAFNNSDLGRIFIADIRKLVARWIWNDYDFRFLTANATNDYRCARHNTYISDCSLLHLGRQTPELRMYSVELNPRSLCCVRNPSYAECLVAVKKLKTRMWTLDVLKYIPAKFHTKELSEIVVTLDPDAIRWIASPTLDLYMLALKLCPALLDSWAQEPIPGLFIQAVTTYPYVFNFLSTDLRTPDICRAVLQVDPTLLDYDP